MDRTAEELRWGLLSAAYDHRMAGQQIFPLSSWQEREGLSDNDVQMARNWLKDHGLVGAMGWGAIAITTAGIDAHEERGRDRPSPSQGVSVEVFRLMEPALGELRLAIDSMEANPDVDQDDLEELRVLVATMELQQRSPRPRRTVLGATVGAAVWVLNHAAGGVIGTSATASVMRLAQALGVG